MIVFQIPRTRNMGVNNLFLLRWNGIRYVDQKVCLNLVKKRPIVCCCAHEQKMNFEGITQNGCYGNQSQPLEVLFDSKDANNPCPFTKQDLIFKQAYLVGFCFVLFNKLKFWQLVLVFSALYRLYLEITLFCTKPSEQIVYCRFSHDGPKFQTSVLLILLRFYFYDV